MKWLTMWEPYRIKAASGWPWGYTKINPRFTLAARKKYINFSDFAEGALLGLRVTSVDF